MIKFYADQARDTEILSSLGKFVSQPTTEHAIKGEFYRSPTGRLKSWRMYRKYEDVLTLEEVDVEMKDTIQELANDGTEVFYCPDEDKRAHEIYRVKLDMRIPAEYSQRTKRYSMVVRVMEI